MKPSNQANQHLRAGFLRRLAAMLYDAIIALAIGLVITMLCLAALVMAETSALITLNNDHGLYLSRQWWFQLLFWGSIGSFYIGFWCRAGQTIGMRAWQLRVQRQDGQLLSPLRATIRLATALLGLGNLLVLLDRNHKLALQDRCTGAEVILLSLSINQVHSQT